MDLVKLTRAESSADNTSDTYIYLDTAEIYQLRPSSGFSSSNTTISVGTTTVSVKETIATILTLTGFNVLNP